MSNIAAHENKNHETVQIRGTDSIFGRFLIRHEQFLLHKYTNLIGVECRLISNYASQASLGTNHRSVFQVSLGRITRIELGAYSTIYTDNDHVRINLCTSGGVIGPIDYDYNPLSYLLPHEVEVYCKQTSPARSQFISLIQELDFPPELWRIIQEYDGPRSWIFFTSNEWTKMHEWFGRFFATFKLSEDCDSCFRETWLR